MIAPRVRALAACAAAVVCIASGCASSRQIDRVPQRTASEIDLSRRPTSTGTITVLEPQAGATVAVGAVTVRIDLQGATISEVVSTDLTPDEGHIHVALDGTTLTLLSRETYVIDDVGPGPHILNVEFAAKDHGPFNPPVVVLVPFTAE